MPGKLNVTRSFGYQYCKKLNLDGKENIIVEQISDKTNNLVFSHIQDDGEIAFKEFKKNIKEKKYIPKRQTRFFEEES